MVGCNFCCRATCAASVKNVAKCSCRYCNLASIQSVNVVGFCYPKNGGDSVSGGDGSEGGGVDGGNCGFTVMLAIIIIITLMMIVQNMGVDVSG